MERVKTAISDVDLVKRVKEELVGDEAEEWSDNAGPCKQVKILRRDTVEPQRSLTDPLPGGGGGASKLSY